VGEDERRAVRGLDRLRDRQRLAGPGRAEQDLVLQALLEAVGQAFDGLGLVAGGLEGATNRKSGTTESTTSRSKPNARSSLGPPSDRWRCVWYHPPISTRYPLPRLPDATNRGRPGRRARHPPDQPTPSQPREAFRPRWRWNTRTTTAGASS
jgi:hypothetical protein